MEGLGCLIRLSNSTCYKIQYGKKVHIVLKANPVRRGKDMSLKTFHVDANYKFFKNPNKSQKSKDDKMRGTVPLLWVCAIEEHFLKEVAQGATEVLCNVCIKSSTLPGVWAC